MSDTVINKKPDITLSRYQVDKAIAEYLKRLYPINDVFTNILPDGRTEVYFIK